MTDSLLEQFKKRRLALGLKQSDMMLRAGVSRQQYQRLESKGNPRLATLDLIAQGLNGELLFIPREKLSAVVALLEGTALENNSEPKQVKKSLSDDPWQDLLEDDE